MVKIFFSDFWEGFNNTDNFIFNNLKRIREDIVFDSNPDFLFYSSQGSKYTSFKNCVRVYYTGENDVPNFNNCDYAMSFHPIDFGDRHLRFPLYLLYDNCFEQIRREKNVSLELANRKFCNFVYSNSKLADPFREYFFHELSKYKKIDSGGRLLNNVGTLVADKKSFIQNYKFTIAFENSSVKGYTTEKIIEPMVMNSMPIYWGNPQVNLDFNEDSFIWIKEKSKIKEMIDYIVFLDENADEYLNKLSLPWLTQEQAQKDWIQELTSFLDNIVSQSPLLAKRTTDYGYVRLVRSKDATLPQRFFSFFKNE